MSVFIQYAPPALSGGRDWDGPARHEFAETVLSQIAENSPNFRDLIRHYEVRSPFDIERETGLTEGNIFQGELTMDQLIFKPADPRLRAVPRANPQHVYVRLQHASGRRRDGRAWRQRRARNPKGLPAQGL